MTNLRLFIPIYVYIFHPTDQVSALEHKKMTIYFYMRLMVEPNIVFLLKTSYKQLPSCPVSGTKILSQEYG